MRYIIITSSNYPYGGAAANYLRLFSQGVSECGGSVTMLLLKGHIYGTERKKENRINQYRGITYVHCGFVNRPFNGVGKLVDSIVGFFYSAYYIVLKSDRDTVILNYTNEIHLYFLSFLVAKIFKRKTVSFVPEGIENLNKCTSLLGYMSDAGFKLSMNYFNLKSSKLIVFSTFLKRYYTSRGYNEKDILIIPNLLDIDFFYNPENEELKKRKVFRIGYCGNPSQKDGIKDLFASFKLVIEADENCELLIIGDAVGGNSVLEELAGYVGNDQLMCKVKMTGLLPFDQVPTNLHSCDVLVLARPSGIQGEAGFPTKLGEYFACKKPVVITKVGDIPLLFTDGENVLLAEPNNPPSVAEKILWVKNNKECALQIAENGYKWAKAHLHYRTNTSRMLHFIQG